MVWKGQVERALKKYEKEGDRKSYAECLMVMGQLYHGIKKFEQAQDYYLSALEIFKELLYDDGKLLAYYVIGLTNEELQKFTSAEEYYLTGLDLAKTRNDWEIAHEFALCLAHLYDLQGVETKVNDFYLEADSIKNSYL